MSLTPRLDRLDKNYIINGNFDFWQRGNSFTSAAAYFADRFRNNASNSATRTITRESAILPNGNSVYCMKYLVGTADASVAAGDYEVILHRFEGSIIKPIYGKTIEVGFWVRSSITGVLPVYLRGGSPQVHYTKLITINSANTWEFKVFKVTHPGSGNGWATDNTLGLDLVFTLMCGTSFQETNVESWQPGGGGFGHATGMNLMGTAGATFYLSQVQLVESTDNDNYILSSDKYIPAGRNYAEELQLCQRYYTKTLNVDIAPNTPNGDTVNWIRQRMLSDNSDGSLNLRYHFPVTMRGIPVAAAYSPVTGATGVIRDQTSDVDRTAAIPVSTIHHVQVTNSGVGYIISNSYAVHITADAEL